ncbi:unnamed protein product [Porites lobata]|uniref:Uncharacterized protein n=1 Tax=Porites lobata TaxID=104759 RepID=A0ABN8Q7R0_9CNID|nr:unnamed protein product [Porites lobata]
MTPLQMKQTPKEVKKKSFCLKMKGDHLQLDENHNYFYRVQDPHIGLNGLFVQRIYFKKKKSESEWPPKLTEFYFNHLLPVYSSLQ